MRKSNWEPEWFDKSVNNYWTGKAHLYKRTSIEESAASAKGKGKTLLSRIPVTEWQLQMVSMSRRFYLYISSWEQLRHLNGYSWNILFQIHFSGQYEKYGQFPWQRK